MKTTARYLFNTTFSNEEIQGYKSHRWQKTVNKLWVCPQCGLRLTERQKKKPHLLCVGSKNAAFLDVLPWVRVTKDSQARTYGNTIHLAGAAKDIRIHLQPVIDQGAIVFILRFPGAFMVDVLCNTKEVQTLVEYIDKVVEPLRTVHGTILVMLNKHCNMPWHKVTLMDERKSIIEETECGK